MTDVPERIWATPFDPEVMEGGTYCDAATRPTAPNHDAWCYLRADLSSPLGVVVMRDAMVKALDERGQREQVDFGLGRETQNFYRAREIVKAIPLPTHADMLAHAMRLPEVAALRKALHFYADFYENPNEGPWGVNSEDFGKVARKALEAKP